MSVLDFSVNLAFRGLGSPFVAVYFIWSYIVAHALLSHNSTSTISREYNLRVEGVMLCI